MLKILHISTSDVGGGAARAAFRITTAQAKAGLDSRLVVLRQREPHPLLVKPLGHFGSLLPQAKSLISRRLLRSQKTTNVTLHSLNVFSSGLVEWINNSDADIVNLHWVGGEMLSITEIGKIRKPLCWTMHDMWPFSGAEHYDDLANPERYKTGYTKNNRPAGYCGPDLDAWTWRRKKKAWANTRFNLISPSHWLADCARNSALLGHHSIHVIPNPVDLTVFKPHDRQLARRILGLQEDRRYILFGAMSCTGDKRKGFHLLQPAIQALTHSTQYTDETEVLIFGANAPENPPNLGLKTHYLGSFHDEISLSLLYSAADVFVAPSMQDNLPNTLVEAIACGTPCVAFNIGGIPDLIISGKTGFIADPFNAMSLSNAIIQALELHPSPTREKIRAFAEGTFSEEIVANKYVDLYKKILF